MERSIDVSTDVFAAIWAQRQDGENSEDEIMRRILGCGRSESPAAGISAGAGFYDSRNSIQFEEGFEAIRSYKGKQYKGLVKNGAWLRPDTGERFQSLSALNQSIVAGNENVWNGNWKYRDKDGKTYSINRLRKKSSV